MTTFTTVGWWNNISFNSLSNSFVLDKLSKLKKCPRVRASSFSLSSWLLISIFSNASKIFKCNDAVSLKCISYYCLADDMVDMTLKPSLFPRQQFQQLPTSTSATARAFRGFLLARRVRRQEGSS